jgi:hypothetical protein
MSRNIISDFYLLGALDSMYQLAKRNGIPDVTVSKKFPWTREAFYIFGSTLQLPMLNHCLTQYKQLQKALATYV